MQAEQLYSEALGQTPQFYFLKIFFFMYIPIYLVSMPVHAKLHVEVRGQLAL